MSSKPASPATMETPTTAFNALFKHAGPIDHLQVLRGNPKGILLLTDEYMSPALHNSSDTYHRLLRSQLQHGIELAKGQHQRQWINKTKEREAFMRFASHLEIYTEPFLHGFRSQHHKDASEIKRYGETKKEFAKREFLKKEERGMARLGWSPGDLYEIKRTVIEEDSMIVQRMEEGLDRERINRSTSSDGIATTDVSSVFDKEDNDNDTDSDEDNDEHDHIYSFDDGKPECRTYADTSICEPAKEQAQSTEASEASTEPTEECLAFASQEILRINSTLSADNLYSSKKPFLEERLFEQRSGDKAAAVLGGPNKKDRHGLMIDAHSEPMAFPSPLPLSFCYKRCSQDYSDSDIDSDIDSDNDSNNNSDKNDHWSTSCQNSPSPPTSLFYDSASIIPNSYGESREPLPSPARQRKAKFLADLLAVRAQVAIDNEEDWEYKVWSKKERMQEKILMLGSIRAI